MADAAPTKRPWWREPALRYLAVGAALFAAERAARREPAATPHPVPRSVIDEARAESLRRGRGEPTPEALSAAVERRLDDEALSREAIARGMHRDNPAVRARLAERMRAAIRESLTVEEPDDAALRAWLDAHRDHYRRPSRVAVEHLFFSRARRGANAEADARAALDALRRGATDVSSDPSPLGRGFGPGPEGELVARFGEGLAQRALALPVGVWSEPVESPLGLHLVRVASREGAEAPDFERLREPLRADVMVARRREAEARAVAELRRRYGVTLAPR
ncbi:MAG: peptidylprolyl isomerase [Polyangiales bacterium]